VVHSDCRFFAPCTNNLTYLITFPQTFFSLSLPVQLKEEN